MLVRGAAPLARANGIGIEHYDEREFSLCWSEVVEYPSLVSTKLDHYERHVQRSQDPCSPFPYRCLSLTVQQSGLSSHYFGQKLFLSLLQPNYSIVAVLGFLGRNESETPVTVHPAALLVYKRRMLLSHGGR